MKGSSRNSRNHETFLRERQEFAVNCSVCSIYSSILCIFINHKYKMSDCSYSALFKKEHK
jgi:hypothetical protein